MKHAINSDDVRRSLNDVWKWRSAFTPNVEFPLDQLVIVPWGIPNNGLFEPHIMVAATRDQGLFHEKLIRCSGVHHEDFYDCDTIDRIQRTLIENYFKN